MLFDVFLLYGIYCISLSCLTALPMASSSTLNKNGKSGCPILDTGFRRNAFNFFHFKKFGCIFLIHSLYCIEIYSFQFCFIQRFYQEVILNFDNSLFHIYLFNYVIFLMSSLFVCHQHISGTCMELLSLQIPEVLIYYSTSRVY